MIPTGVFAVFLCTRSDFPRGRELDDWFGYRFFEVVRSIPRSIPVQYPFNTSLYGLSSSVAQLCLQSRWDVCLGNALRSIPPRYPPFNTSPSIPPFNTLLNRRLPHIHRGPGVLTHSNIYIYIILYFILYIIYYILYN